MNIAIMAGFTTIQSYTIIAVANGFAMGKSPTAPSPYAVWQVDDGKGVYCGHYFVDRDEAEWDFCARAFEWFEDNMYIHMIENDESTEDASCEKCKFNTNDYVCHPHCSGCNGKSKFVSRKPPTDNLLGGLKEIRSHMAAAAQLVDEMRAEVERLTAEREANKCHQR